MSSFLTTLAAMSLIAIVGFLLRPFFPSWLRRLRGFYAWLRAKDEELREHFRNFLWKPQTESQRISRAYVLKYVRNRMLVLMPVIAFDGVVFGVIGPSFERDVQSTRVELLQILQRQLQRHEGFSTQLLQRTSERIGPRSFCEKSLQEIEKKRAQVLCATYAENHVSATCYQGEPSLGTGLLRYDTCMLERGWLVSRCRAEESGCIRIDNAGAMCETQYWKTDSSYVGKDCLGYIPEDSLVKRIELQCSQKATQFAYESLYQGYDEVDRIYSTSRVYATCMIANGWITLECLGSDDPDEDCVEIFYPVNPCRTKLEKWIEKEDRDYDEIPCNGEL